MRLGASLEVSRFLKLSLPSQRATFASSPSSARSLPRAFELLALLACQRWCGVGCGASLQGWLRRRLAVWTWASSLGNVRGLYSLVVGGAAGSELGRFFFFFAEVFGLFGLSAVLSRKKVVDKIPCPSRDSDLW